MDQLSQQAATAAPAAVPAQAAAPESSVEDQFQSLAETLWNQPGEAPETAKEPAKTEAATQPATEDKDAPETQEAAKPAESQEAETKDYESLDAYLTEAKLDKESFYELPVPGVKVDGVESAVPIKELVKGYQLAQASYNRMNEVATQRQQLQTEQQQVRQALGVRIQQIEALATAASDQLLGDYNAITPQQWQQLRNENPGEYAALTTQFQARQQAVQQLMQQAAQVRQQEAEQAKQAQLQAIPAEREKLYQARPEWRDQGKFEAAKQSIVAAGRKLGFTDAELQSVTDHRQLLMLDLAAKALQLQASQPGVLKRVRAAPKMAQPAARQVRDPSRERITTALERARATGYRDENALADAFEAVG